MGFQFSDRSKDLQLRISSFLMITYPAEEIYAQQWMNSQNKAIDGKFHK